MLQDRFSSVPHLGIDCICLTLNAELHLQETLDTWYREAPVRRLLVIDGGSTDSTLKILSEYPRVSVWVYPGMTTGKAWELLKYKVETSWFIWIDVGKIPRVGWYDEMIKYTNEGDLLGSIRYNYKDGQLIEDPVIMDCRMRLLGGPWMIRTKSLGSYHVEDDFAQRNIDIIIRQALEKAGGRYHLVTSTSHLCYLPVPVNGKELEERIIQNAKGIVKYIDPEYAREHAQYLLNDHWMLKMHRLPDLWIEMTNPEWFKILKSWRRKRLLLAKAERLIYNTVMRR